MVTSYKDPILNINIRRHYRPLGRQKRHVVQNTLQKNGLVGSFQVKVTKAICSYNLSDIFSGGPSISQTGIWAQFFCKIFAENCRKLKKLDQEGSAPLTYPFGFANGIFHCCIFLSNNSTENCNSSAITSYRG